MTQNLPERCMCGDPECPRCYPQFNCESNDWYNEEKADWEYHCQKEDRGDEK